QKLVSRQLPCEAARSLTTYAAPDNNLKCVMADSGGIEPISVPAGAASVPSLERGMAIVEIVARSKRGLTLSQVARALQLPKSSAHYLLRTLQRLGYLCRNEATHRYFCDEKLVRIASLALGGAALRVNARPILRKLSEQTQLTVHLAVRNDT